MAPSVESRVTSQEEDSNEASESAGGWGDEWNDLDDDEDWGDMDVRKINKTINASYILFLSLMYF